ncbi:MAG: hypothetical protein O3A92_15810 [Verrucomicrobia bacterium]|nr:hypothetical protein [Verrucomicrobiota bacterium]
MIPLLFSLALLTVGVPGDSDHATETPQALPAAPTGHVLDRMDWLSEERRLTLEAELSRIHKEHDVNLFVVVWDRRLPDDQRPEDLAALIGHTWSPGEVWGTVLLTPGAINRPIAVTGGKQLTPEEDAHLAAAAAYSVDFGRKAWTDQDRLQQTALVLSEELVFARQTMTDNTTAITGSAAPLLPPASFLSPPLLAAAGGLVLLAVTLLWFTLRRRKQPTPEPAPEPATRTFPAPAVQTRLGAPWSGGSSLLVPLPTKPSA